jgi:hypothetical protein
VTIAGVRLVCVPREIGNLQHHYRRSPEIVTRLLSLAWLWAGVIEGAIPRSNEFIRFLESRRINSLLRQVQYLVRHLKQDRKSVCLGRARHFSAAAPRFTKGLGLSLLRWQSIS